jgi:hypothetical protein
VSYGSLATKTVGARGDREHLGGETVDQFGDGRAGVAPGEGEVEYDHVGRDCRDAFARILDAGRHARHLHARLLAVDQALQAPEQDTMASYQKDPDGCAGHFSCFPFVVVLEALWSAPGARPCEVGHMSRFQQ